MEGIMSISMDESTEADKFFVEFLESGFFDWRCCYRLGQEFYESKLFRGVREDTEPTVTASTSVAVSRPVRTLSSDVDSAFGGSDDVSPICSRTSNEVELVDLCSSDDERQDQCNQLPSTSATHATPQSTSCYQPVIARLPLNLIGDITGLPKTIRATSAQVFLPAAASAKKADATLRVNAAASTSLTLAPASRKGKNGSSSRHHSKQSSKATAPATTSGERQSKQKKHDAGRKEAPMSSSCTDALVKTIQTSSSVNNKEKQSQSVNIQQISKPVKFCRSVKSRVQHASIQLPVKLKESAKSSLVSHPVIFSVAQSAESIDITLLQKSFSSTAAQFVVRAVSIENEFRADKTTCGVTFCLSIPNSAAANEIIEISDSSATCSNSSKMVVVTSNKMQQSKSSSASPSTSTIKNTPISSQSNSGSTIKAVQQQQHDTTCLPGPPCSIAKSIPPLIDLELENEIMQAEAKRPRIEPVSPIPYRLAKLVTEPDLSTVPTFPLYNPSDQLTSELLKCGNFKFHKHARQKVKQQAASSTVPRFVDRPRYQPFEVPDHMKRRESDRNAHRISDVQLWSQAAIDERMARDKDTPGCIRYMNEQCSGTGNVSADDLAALHVEHVQNTDCFSPGLGRFASPDAAAKLKDAQTFFEHGSVRRKRGLLDECVELSAMKLYTAPHPFCFAGGYSVYPSSDTSHRM